MVVEVIYGVRVVESMNDCGWIGEFGVWNYRLMLAEIKYCTVMGSMFWGDAADILGNFV